MYVVNRERSTVKFILYICPIIVIFKYHEIFAEYSYFHNELTEHWLLKTLYYQKTFTEQIKRVFKVFKTIL